MSKPHTDRFLPVVFKKLSQQGWKLGRDIEEESPVFVLERLAHACLAACPTKSDQNLLPLPDWFLSAFRDACAPGARQSPQKLITSYLDFTETSLDILDAMMLWLDHAACRKTDPRNIHGLFKARQNELRDNAFYRKLAPESFVYKMDNTMLRGSRSEKLSLRHRLQFLGGLSCENLATDAVRTDVHDFLLSRYKTDTIPNTFNDYFDSSRNSPFFGHVMVVSGYFILYFSIHDYLAGLRRTTIVPQELAELETSSIERMIEYFRTCFVNGIALHSPESHFRYDKILVKPFQRKMALLFWRSKLRDELLRRENDPVKMRGAMLSGARNLDDAGGLDYHSAQLLGRIQPGTAGSFDLINPANSEYSSLPCRMLGLKEGRLVLGAQSDGLKLSSVGIGDVGVFRFSIKNQSNQTKFYACPCLVQHVQSLADTDSILVAAPKRAVVSLDRRHPRVAMDLLSLQAISGWFGLTDQPQNLVEMQRLGPAHFTHPDFSEMANLENISAGGVCLNVHSPELWEKIRDTHAKFVLLKLILSKDASSDMTILLICQVCSLRQDDRSCFAGLRFLAEADCSAAGRCRWLDICESGCQELSRLVFSALLRLRKGA